MSRRAFLRLGLYGVPAACAGDAFLVEPKWLKVRHVELTEGSTCRLVHFTDVHYKGDKEYLSRVVSEINALEPDIVCFTGDLVESTRFLDEALGLLAGIRCPMFGVPGNWDPSGGALRAKYAACFEGTGGAWLEDREVLSPDGQVAIVGARGRKPHLSTSLKAPRSVLLAHYPAYCAGLKGAEFDLMLAGHSHGGQVRVPFFGALIVPDRVGDYEKGMYDVPAGKLYVNPGIGTWLLRVRFWCRPEITVLQL